MEIVAIKIEPTLLINPDADLRYKLPDLLAERSKAVIQDNGYDYVGPSNALVLYLRVSNLESAITCINDLIANVRVLDNDLRPAVTVAIKRGDEFEVLYPTQGTEPASEWEGF